MFGLLFWLVCQNCLQRVQRRILKEQKYLSFSDFQLLILEHMAEKKRTGHQNCFVRVETNFLAKLLLRKKNCFHHFRNVSKNFWDFWQESFAMIVKPSFYVSGRTIWAKKKSWKCSFKSYLNIGENHLKKFKRKKIALHFLTLSCWFSGLWQKTNKGHQNCFVRVERNFSAKLLLRKFFFHPFRMSANTTGIFGRKLLT